MEREVLDQISPNSEHKYPLGHTKVYKMGFSQVFKIKSFVSQTTPKIGFKFVYMVIKMTQVYYGKNDIN